MKGFLNKAKNLMLGVFALGATAANAAVTMSDTGAVSGSFDMAPIYQVAGIIFTALASIVVIKWVISFIKRA